MGSYSLSQSSTSYTNTPLTLQDNAGGVALAGNRDTLLGGTGNTSGSSNVGNNDFKNTGTYNALDGGAIQRAFDSTDKSIAAIADLTAKIVNGQSSANVAALQFTEKANAAALAASNPTATAEKTTNTTLMIFGGLVALYLVMKGYK